MDHCLFPSHKNMGQKSEQEMTQGGRGAGTTFERMASPEDTTQMDKSSQPRDQTPVSYTSCIGRHILYYWTTWEAFIVTCQQAKWHTQRNHDSSKVNYNRPKSGWWPNSWRLHPVPKIVEIILPLISLWDFCCCSVTELCLTPCDPMDCSTQVPLSSTISQSLPRFMSSEMVMLPNHLILCLPLLLLPSIFPNVKVFSNESALHIETIHLRFYVSGLEPRQKPAWDLNPCGWASNLAQIHDLPTEITHLVLGPSVTRVLDVLLQKEFSEKQSDR